MKYLLVVLFVYVASLSVVKCDYWSDLMGTTCYNYPRVRQNWCSLTYKQRATWVAITHLMRNTKIPGYSDNYYKSFVDMHSVASNSNLSHGTSIFFLWHRPFMWHLENCFRYFAYTYRAQLNLSVDEACSVSAPYWAWEVDYENSTTDSYIPQDHSCIWEFPELFGPAPTHPNTGVIASGNYTASNWVTNFAQNANPTYFTNPTYGTLNYCLYRQFNTAYNFIHGPSQIMQAMCSTPTYVDFMSFIEGGPHSNVHLWFGYEMKSMNSPEEPIFFLHHCNIERLNTLHQDCWDYEYVQPSAMTPTQYKPNNPNPFPTYVSASSYKRDIYGNIGNVTIDNPMNYNWKTYMIGSSTTYTNVAVPWMPFGTWPSPRQAFFVGFTEAPTKGYDNMIYTYASDNLVNTLGSCCTKNTQWNFFPTPPGSSAVGKKRDASKKFEITEESVVTAAPNNITVFSANEDFVYSSITLQMSELKKKGLCVTDALEALAMQECQQSAKQGFPPDMEDWMKMNGLVPEQFKRICDDVDSSYYSEQGVVFSAVEDGDSTHTTSSMNVWATAGFCIAGVVVLAAMIAGIVIFAKRRENKGDSDYLNM